MIPREARPALGGPSIVFLVPSLALGGAERQLVGLSAGLHAAGWRVLVLRLYPGGELETDLVRRGVPTTALDRRGRWDVIRVLVPLLRVLRRERPAVLHSYLVTPNVLSAFLKPFLPGVRIVWGVRAAWVDLARYRPSVTAVFTLSRGLARFADLIICNSSAGMEYHVARGYPASRTVVIPNGIDATEFAPKRDARAALRRQWGFGEDDLVVGLVARLDPMKDHETFIRAAARVAALRDDVRFVCVGDGPAGYQRRLWDLASEVGLGDRMVLAGGRLDLPDVYNAFDLAVSSSSGEGFSNVIAEAMACGVPCVVTDVGDSRSIVGPTGWWCRPRDPVDLARAIGCAVASKVELAGRGLEARRRVMTLYTEERRDSATAEHLVALLSEER